MLVKVFVILFLYRGNIYPVVCAAYCSLDVSRRTNEITLVRSSVTGYSLNRSLEFSDVSPDMKLEQSIQRSKKGPGRIIGQTKQQA